MIQLTYILAVTQIYNILAMEMVIESGGYVTGKHDLYKKGR